MRTRAYRPEPPASLEGRALLSAQPIVLLQRQLNFVLDHMRGGFFVYDRTGDASQIYNEIEDVVPMIPYNRTDGLQASLDHIVDTMRHELRAHVPGPLVHMAAVELTATTLADVQARIRSGDVVIRG